MGRLSQHRLLDMWESVLGTVVLKFSLSDTSED